MVDIKITRASVLKEKPASSTLVFGRQHCPDEQVRRASVPSSDS